MIYAKPTDPVEAVLEGAPTGLTGTVGVKIIDPPGGAVIVPRTTTGIAEIAPGVYAWTTTAPATPGSYLVVWDQPPADAAHTWTEQLTVNQLGAPESPVEGVTPDVAEVGALLRARTVDRNGNEIGTFNTDTRPTGDEATELIEFAVADVAARVGALIPDIDIPEARRLASLEAAALVESSYFPGEIDTDRSAYRQYTAMFLDGVKALTRRVRAASGAGMVSATLVSPYSGDTPDGPNIVDGLLP